MTRWRLLGRIVVAGLVAAGSVACNELTSACDFTIAGVSSHSPIPDVGARLPADAPVVVTEEEIDWARSISGTDATGQPSITLRLRPVAAPAFRQYTATHIGEMLAIAVDDQLVSVPTINEQIEGEVSISGLPGSGDLEPLRRCVPDA